MQPQRRKILIIEDNAADREVYKRCLWQASADRFEFAEAESAQTGIDMARSWIPDCLLLDLNLPDMDGFDVLTTLKETSQGIPCATVILTAFGAESTAIKALQAGAMDYLPKEQVTAYSLPHIVRNAMERFRMQQRIEEQAAALEQSGQRYQLLLEAMPQMVWTANAEGRVEYANRRLLDYAGVRVEDTASLKFDQFVHPEDQEQTIHSWQRAMESGAPFESEHRLRQATDGTYRWHLVRAVPMRGAAGQVTNWLGTCTEIENQKQAERAIFEGQKLECIGRLAGGLAHDFNNLLVTILCGACSAMEDLPSAHPAQEMLQWVLQAGERAAEITRQMLAYAGKGNFSVARADFSELVHDAIAQASVPKTIQVEFDRARQLPAVETDCDQLRKVIVDVVRNAVEAIEEGASGTISVRTAAVELGEESARREFGTARIGPGKYLALEVGDTGCGIDEKTQEKIFDPFFTTKFAGRGLGLAAARGFIRSNGGDVQVNSAPGKGTRLRILLPAAQDGRTA